MEKNFTLLSSVTDKSLFNFAFTFWIMGRTDVLTCDDLSKAARVFIKKWDHLDQYKDKDYKALLRSFYNERDKLVRSGIYFKQCEND